MESHLLYGEPQSDTMKDSWVADLYLFLFGEEKSSKETDKNLT